MNVAQFWPKEKKTETNRTFNRALRPFETENKHCRQTIEIEKQPNVSE